MKKRKPNPLMLYGKWKNFLLKFEEKGVHTSSFPEDILRSNAENCDVLFAKESNVVFGTIFKDKPLVVLLLIHPKNPSVEIITFAELKARSFLGTDSSITYPPDTPPVSPEELQSRIRQTLALAFPEEITEKLLAEMA
jgi:hypothetical protein